MRVARARVTACSACGSDRLVSLGIEETFGVQALETEVTIEFGSCTACGLVLQLNPLEADSLETYYERSLQLRSASVTPVELDVFRQQAAFIETSRSLARARVLEIGPDAGQFLTYLASNHGAEAFYVEQSEEARRVLAAETTHVAADLRAEDGAEFDVVVVRHVLEHVPSPRDWLAVVRERCARDGVLFVEVPDWTVLDERTDRLNFEHLACFSQLSLSMLLARAGYAAIRQETAVNPGYPTTGNRVLRVLARPLSALLGDARTDAVVDHLAGARLRYDFLERLARDGGTRTRLALYGASWTTDEVLRHTSLDGRSVAAIFDKDPRKQGTVLGGIRVRPPEDLHEVAPDVIVILSSYERQIREELACRGFRGRVLSWDDCATAST